MPVKVYSALAILLAGFVGLLRIDWLSALAVVILLFGLIFVGGKVKQYPPTYEGLPKKFDSGDIAIYTILNTTFPVYGGTMLEDGSVIKFGVTGLKVRRSGDAKMYVLDRFGNVNES